jgi:hypothetical protein
MPIFADTREEEIDSAGVPDVLFICGALCLEVLDGAVQNMHLLGGDVDVGEELGEPARGSGTCRDMSSIPAFNAPGMHAHEAMIALGVVAGQADVLVHVEGDDVFERESACVDEGDEVFVGGDGG